MSIAATFQIRRPEQLGEGRFAAQDFLREINTLAAIFTTVRVGRSRLPTRGTAARARTAVRR